MKKLLTFLTLLTLFFTTAGATIVTFTSAEDANGTTIVKDGVTIICSASSKSYFQCYKGASMVIESESNITNIELTCTANGASQYGPGCFGQVTPGTYSYSGKIGTWTGNSNSIRFTTKDANGSNTNQVRMTKIVVTIEDSGTPTCATPTFTPNGGTFYEPQTVTLSSTTEGATIYYTKDGNTPDPATSQSVANNGTVTIDATCTLTAIATATGYDPSSSYSKLFTIHTPETVVPTYEETFDGTFGKFYNKDVTGTNIWQTNSGYAKASGYVSGSSTASESWLISPYIDLTDASNPELSFTHAGNYFYSQANMQNDVKLRIKKQGENSWSYLTIETWPNGSSWTFAENTTSLADYAGEIVQIAFEYTSSADRAGTWEIKNFKVQDNDPSAPSYYLVGSFNMDGNTWVTGDEDYKFEESNGTYVLNNVNFDAANTTFKIIKIENGQTTWYGGTGDVDYNIHHTHHENLPMNGGQNYKIQSAGVTSFSFTVSDNTPGNLNVNRDAKLYIKGGFNNWEEELMTVSSGEWTTSQTIAENQEFGFVDEFGQWRGKEWTIYSEHMNGYEIPVETSGNYKMGVAGTYTLSVNSELTKLVVNSVTGDVYTLVESATDLVAGQEYLIATLEGENPEVVLLGAVNSSNLGSTVHDNFVYNASDKTITVQNGCSASILTLGGSEGAWTFNNGSGYLAYTKEQGTDKNNNLFLVTDVTVNGTQWIINTDEISAENNYCSNKLIQNAYNTERYLQYNYNSGNDRFACYKSLGQKGVALFKKGSATPSNKTATPVITPDSKDVKGGLLEGITITAGEEGTTPVIYYTTDGSDPGDASNANRVQYTEPFDMQVTQGGPQTVKAIAIENGKDPSSIASVTYTFKNPDAPTFTPDPAVVQTGDFTITINSADGGVIYYVLDPDANEFPSNSEEAIATGQVYADVVAVSGTGEHKIYAAVVLNGLKSTLSTATYTVIETGAEGDWQLVTSVDQITDGYDYIIVNSDHDRAIKSGALETSRFYSVECENNVVFGPNFATATVAGSDVRIFGFETEGDNIYMKDADNSRYYNFATDVSTGKQPVYITMADGFVYIKGAAEATKSLAYNTAYGNYFGIYATPTTTTGSQRPIYLYRRGVQQTPIMTLADICKYGVTTEGKNEYIIADKLQAVYAYTKGGNSLLWCKDLDNKSIVPTTIHSGQIDFMRSEAINYDTEEGVHNGQQGPWDQSNWIVLQFTNPTGSNNIDQMLQNAQDKFIKPGTIKGKLVDDVNYILKVDLDQLDLVTPADPDYDEEPYNENVYCPANFLPENLNIDDGIENGDGAETGNQNYFFMNPKVQEICYITYAQWDDYGYFAVPSSSNFSSGIDGAFQVGWVYQDKPALDPGKIYKFHAVVHRVGKEYGPQNPVSTKDGMPVYENITVLPIDLTADSEIVTSINTVDVAGNGVVKSVKYVNVAGMVSDVPFQGVNIVVTEYSDGSRSTSKMLRK